MTDVLASTKTMADLGQGNIEAVMKSTQIWAAGLQDLSAILAESMKTHLDHTMATYKALASIKSIKDALELQSQAARTAYEQTAAELAKMTDKSMKLAEATMAPITAQMAASKEKLTPS